MLFLIILGYSKTIKENFMSVIGPVYKPVYKSISSPTFKPVNTYYRNFKYYIDIDGLAVDTYKNF
jgi:hypothetical protein